MRILVYRPAGGLGDIITVLPALAGLRRKHPAAHIAFLGLRPYEILITRTGCVDEFIRVRSGVRRPSNEDPDVRLAMRRMRITHTYDLLVNLWCPAGKYESESGGNVEKSRIECFCEAAGVSPTRPELPLMPAETEAARATLAEHGLQHPLVCLQLHSAFVAKNWPRQRYDELAKRLAARGVSILAFRQDGPPLSVGVTVEGLGHFQLAALLAEADLLIAPDSGLMHLAGAVGTRCLALFGPTDPRTTLRFYPTHEAIWHPDVAGAVGCHCPCYYLPGVGFRANGRCSAEGECIRAITVDEVEAAAWRCLEQGARSVEPSDSLVTPGPLPVAVSSPSTTSPLSPLSACGEGTGERPRIPITGAAPAAPRPHGADYLRYMREGCKWNPTEKGDWQRIYAGSLKRVFDLAGKRILDIGSACGAQVSAMLDAGLDAWASEPEEHLIRVSPFEHLRGRFACCPAERLLYRDELFDFVHASVVFEHIPEELAPVALREMARVAKVGAILYATLRLAEDRVLGETDDDITHVNYQSRQTWADWLVAAGWNPISDYDEALSREPLQQQYKWSTFVCRRAPDGPFQFRQTLCAGG